MVKYMSAFICVAKAFIIILFEKLFISTNREIFK